MFFDKITEQSKNTSQLVAEDGRNESAQSLIPELTLTLPKLTLRMMTYGPQTFKKISILSLKLVILSLFSAQLFKKYRTHY